jgi:predicted PP-loop superfamily ATPase
MSYQSSIASELASALWNCSTLRHGMFTPHQFRKLCEKIILERILDQNVKTRVVEKGESLESGDLVKEKVIMDLKLPCFFSSNEPKPVVGTTSHCYEGQYFRPIQ